MATCQDLVNVLADINLSIQANAINIDALREAVLCQTELIKQIFPDRNFIAAHMSTTNAFQAELITAHTAAMNQLARVWARTDIPAAYAGNLIYPAPGDVVPFQACSSTVYCPPGKIKNEQGECVDPS